MIKFDGMSYETFQIRIPTADVINKVHFKYLTSMSKKTCVGNGRLSYFSDDGKLDPFYAENICLWIKFFFSLH